MDPVDPGASGAGATESFASGAREPATRRRAANRPGVAPTRPGHRRSETRHRRRRRRGARARPARRGRAPRRRRARWRASDPPAAPAAPAAAQPLKDGRRPCDLWPPGGSPVGAAPPALGGADGDAPGSDSAVVRCRCSSWSSSGVPLTGARWALLSHRSDQQTPGSPRTLQACDPGSTVSRAWPQACAVQPAPQRQSGSTRMTQWSHAQEGGRHRWRHRRTGGRVGARRARRDVTVTVYEASDRVGGKLRLEQVGGALVDVGAESVLARRPEALTLFEEIGVDRRTTHPAAVGATIVSGGRRWPMPSGTVMGVPSDPESVRGLLTDDEVQPPRRRAARPHSSSDDVSVGDFVDARLGRSRHRQARRAAARRCLCRSRPSHLPRHGRSRAESRRPRGALAARRRARGPAGGPVGAGRRAAGLRHPRRRPRHPAGRARGRPARRPTSRCAPGAVVRDLRPDGDGWIVSTGPTTDVVRERHDAVVIATPARPTARLLAEIAPAAARRPRVGRLRVDGDRHPGRRRPPRARSRARAASSCHPSRG